MKVVLSERKTETEISSNINSSGNNSSGNNNSGIEKSGKKYK